MEHHDNRASVPSEGIAEEAPPPYNSSTVHGQSGDTLPNYDQVRHIGNAESGEVDNPPSYESLFGQVREAQRNSSNVCIFLKSLFIILLGTIGCTVCIGVVIVLPIAMIIVGSQNVKSCPREPLIPIFLIVGGVFGVLEHLLRCFRRFTNHSDEEDRKMKINPFAVISLFLCSWFISGNVWVYRVSSSWQDDDPSRVDYCNPVCYWFAFWLITTVYIMSGLTCFLLLCASCLFTRQAAQ